MSALLVLFAITSFCFAQWSAQDETNYLEVCKYDFEHADQFNLNKYCQCHLEQAKEAYPSGLASMDSDSFAKREQFRVDTYEHYKGKLWFDKSEDQLYLEDFRFYFNNSCYGLALNGDHSEGSASSYCDCKLEQLLKAATTKADMLKLIADEQKMNAIHNSCFEASRKDL